MKASVLSLRFVTLMAVLVLLGGGCAVSEEPPSTLAGEEPPSTLSSEEEEAPPESEIIHGGVLRIMSYEPPHFDSHQLQQSDIIVTGNTNNRLVHMDPVKGQDIVPDLARTWEFSDDGSVLTFELHEGVFFHDGTPFTCADVKYSFERQIDPPEGFEAQRKALLEPRIDSIACPDDYRVQFNLNGPWAEALFAIGDLYQIIYPEHVARELDAEGQGMRNTIIGTGPFKLKEMIPGERVVLERNENYWKEGLPYLDEIQIFWTEGLDYRNWASALEAGRVDYIMSIDAPAIFNELEELSQGGTIHAVSGPGALKGTVIPDMKDGSIWQDADVRRAAQLALIQDEAIEVLCDTAFLCWFGGALPAADINPWALADDELREIDGFSADAEGRRAEARRILEDKGLIGHEFTMHLWQGFDAFRDTAIWACDALNRVGFECSTSGYEIGAYYEMMNNRRMPVGDMTANTMGGAWPPASVDQTLSQFWLPESIRNYGGFEDQRLPELYAQQSATLDENARRELLYEFQRYALEQNYHMTLGWAGSSRAWSASVQGPGFEPDSELALTVWPTNFEDVWLRADG